MFYKYHKGPERSQDGLAQAKGPSSQEDLVFVSSGSQFGGWGRGQGLRVWGLEVGVQLLKPTLYRSCAKPVPPVPGPLEPSILLQ